jgi:hypothetical protein
LIFEPKVIKKGNNKKWLMSENQFFSMVPDNQLAQVLNKDLYGLNFYNYSKYFDPIKIS